MGDLVDRRRSRVASRQPPSPCTITHVNGLYYPDYHLTPGTGINHSASDTSASVLQNPLCGSANLDPAVDGFIDIKLKDESNAQIGALYNKSVSEGVLAGPYSILKNFVDNQPWWWGSQLNLYGEQKGKVWDTGAFDAYNQYAYPVGTYTVSAESKLNKMKDNYKQGGADYTGKTVSQAYTVTLVSDTVKIEANKDSVVRSKTFSVTVTGRPSTSVHPLGQGYLHHGRHLR